MRTADKLRLEVQQVLKFSGVGVAATIAHTVVFALFMESGLVAALLANFIAYLVALAVAYAGHLFWTFQGGDSRQGALYRYLSVSFAGFLFNSVIVWLVVDYAGYAYWYAILGMVVITPSIGYVLMRQWVF